MANILHKTESFNDAYWTAFDGLTVTANSGPAPAFAGMNATFADTLNDTTTITAASSLYGTYELIPNDGSDWVASLHVRKDNVTTQFAAFGVQMVNGTTIFATCSFNLATGATGGTGDASGVIDIDAVWWRFWMRKANNSTGNTAARMYLYPAQSATLGGVESASLLGSMTAWGANFTNTSTVQPYEPDPTYVLGVAWPVTPVYPAFPKFPLRRSA
jgi:hypothetical protein